MQVLSPVTTTITTFRLFSLVYCQKLPREHLEMRRSWMEWNCGDGGAGNSENVRNTVVMKVRQ